MLKDRARRDAVRGAGLRDEWVEGALPSQDTPPDRVFEDKEAAAHLQAVLLELPQRTRDVFVLRVFEGC